MIKTPRIRLKPFEDEWETVKLKDISIKNTKKNTEELYTNSLTNSAEHGIISQESYFDKKITNVKNSHNYYIVKPDDFVYNPRISIFAPVGPINRNTLNMIGIMSPLYYVFSVHSIHLNFLEVYFKTSFWHHFMYRNGDTGARSDRFSIREQVFLDMPIPYPTKEEQTKISGFFKELDELIELQQLTVENLKELKKGFLQKMLPQNNQKVPEIRFDLFETNWVKEYIGQASESIEYGINAPAKEYDGVHKYLRITDIDDQSRKLINESLTTPNIPIDEISGYKLTEDDIVVARTGASVGKTYRYTSKDGDVYFAGYLIRVRIKPKYSSNFIFQTTLTDKFAKYVKVNSQRSGQPGLNSDEISKYKFYLPLDKEEQELIGEFLDQIEDLIELEQQKLEALKEMKKGFLQKMFV